MKTSCPNCGAEVEFRYDDSFVRVCSYCRHAIARTDRGVDTLGKVADLVPIESPLKLFAEGRLGSTSFLLVGMAQIRHGLGGIWQEWYAKLDGGKWGWLAEAQGRYYLTFEEPAAELPPFDALAPGSVVSLPVHGALHSFTASEHAGAVYVAATGELPYRLVPDGSFRFVDLDDGAGTFATIDYGDTGDPPALYVGQQVTLAELGITGGEDGPSREAKIASTRLACPNCNAPIELRAPGEAQRFACTSCNHLIALDGTLRVLAAQSQRPAPAIPLGSVGKLGEGELTVIGFVQRSAQLDGAWYEFQEYLLHAPAVGFRWLVCSDGHWSYVQPVAAGAVHSKATKRVYDGVTFRAFASAPLRVDCVLGEFYWQVAVGERVIGEDFIAPPAMLSCETSATETTWSLGTYMTVREVKHAFAGQELALPSPIGVAPNQIDRSERAASWMMAGVGVLLAAGIVAAAQAPDRLAYEHAITVHAGVPAQVTTTEGSAAGSAAEPPPVEAPNVFFSDPFQLDTGHNVEIALSSPVDNDWVYATADLVNQQSGDVVEVDADLEYYHGVDGGEAWSEGSRRASRVVGPPASGAYILRLEAQHGGQGDTSLAVAVQQGVFRSRYLLLFMAILGVPWLGLGLHAWSVERRRWENSSRGKPPVTSFALGLAIVTVVGLFVWVLVKLFARAAAESDD